MYIKRFAKIAALCALIFFFTPFVMVSCTTANSSVMYSGVDLMLCIEDDSAQEDNYYYAEISAELDEITEDAKPNIWLIIAFLCCAAGLAVMFYNKDSIASAVLLIISVISLIIFRLTFISYYKLEEFAELIEVKAQWGYILCIISTGASAVSALIKIEGTEVSRLRPPRNIYVQDNTDSYRYNEPQTMPKQNSAQKASPGSFEPKTKIQRRSTYSGTLSVDELLKRAEIFIEDKDWEKALEYSQNALDVDAGCAEAYLYKFMAEYNISDEKRIPVDCAGMAVKFGSLFKIESYRKASLFGSEDIKQKLYEYNRQAIYNYAVDYLDKCDTAGGCDTAIDIFKEIPDYENFKDVNAKLERCVEKKKDLTYERAISLMKSEHYKEAINYFEKIIDFYDSKQKINECEELIKKDVYDRAKRLLENAESEEDFIEARKNFLSISGYADADKMAERCDNMKKNFTYEAACELLSGTPQTADFSEINIKEYSHVPFGKIIGQIEFDLFFSKTDALKKAEELFETIPEHNDSKVKVEECKAKINSLRGQYEGLKRKTKYAVYAFVGCVLLICIAVPVIKNVSKNDEDIETSASATEGMEPDITDNAYEPSGSGLTTSPAHEVNIPEAEFILCNSDKSDTFDYIGTYDGWIYYSDVIKKIKEEPVNLYAIVCFCDVAIDRVNIETGECQSVIRTCRSSCLFDTYFAYYNYDFTIGEDGKLIFTYDDPNSFKVYSSDEYSGKEGYYCDSYVLSYDVSSKQIDQIYYDTFPSEVFYYNGWLIKYSGKEGKQLFVDIIHGKTYETDPNNSFWLRAYDGKYILMMNGRSYVTIDTVSASICEYESDYLEFSYMYDRGDYIYLNDENGNIKYVIDTINQEISDTVPYDTIEAYLPDGSVYIGECGYGTIYKNGNYICLAKDYTDADLSCDRIFDLNNILSNEKSIYDSYDYPDAFQDTFLYYEFNISGNCLVINTTVSTIDTVIYNAYCLDPAAGTCKNVPVSDGTGQYTDASNYIQAINSGDFEYTIGRVSVDSGSLNVREAPDITSDIIGTLENGTVIELYDYENGWYFIYYHDYESGKNICGYVLGDYVLIN